MLRGRRSLRGDRKLTALAQIPPFAGLPADHLVQLGRLLDRGCVSAGAHLARRDRRILQPLIVTGGTAMVHGAGTPACVEPIATLGLDLTDPARRAVSDVTAQSDLDVWFVEPRAIRTAIALVPYLSTVTRLG